MLVFHQRFKRWMPPGGRIKPQEDPALAARRELWEETGLQAEPHPPDPVLLDDRIRVSPDGERVETYGLSYAFVAPAATPLRGEPDQPAKRFALSEPPPDAHPRHWARVAEFARAQQL